MTNPSKLGQPHFIKIPQFYIHEAVVNMRENPTTQAKVVSQAIFSEEVELKKQERDWSYITTSDGYPGWVPSHTFVTRDKPYTKSLKVSRLAAHIYELRDIEYGPVKTLPYGSYVQALDINDARWIKIALFENKEYYIQRGDVAFEQTLRDKNDLIAFSQRFLGLPYTWGGRSSFGYDCSGFIQMLYHELGIELYRDSKQQILDRRFHTIRLDHLEPGDLIFFGKSEQKIMHVGMFLNNNQFIHASSRENQPWIRTSLLSDFEWSGDSDAYYPYRLARQLSI